MATVIYLVFGKAIGKDTASWLCIIMAAPLAVAGFFNYNGMNMEQFIWAFIKSEFLLSAPRKYTSEYPNRGKEGYHD